MQKSMSLKYEPASEPLHTSENENAAQEDDGMAPISTSVQAAGKADTRGGIGKHAYKTQATEEGYAVTSIYERPMPGE